MKRIVTRANYWMTIGISRLPWSRSLFVLGYPRSGTNWLCNLVAHYFDRPVYFPYEALLPSVQPVVLNMHRFSVVPPRTVYIQRDGRDALASYYFEVLRTFPRGARFKRLRELCPDELTTENARANLPGFIEWLVHVNRGGAPFYDFHIRESRRRGLFTIRYEDLLVDGEKTLSASVEHLTRAPVDLERVRAALSANAFKKRTGRKPGEEDRAVHTRKGVVGDWANHFTPDAARVFDRYAGDALIEAGYEQDHAWVEEFCSRAQRA